MADSLYSSIRASVDESGSDSRVEVNQRALIDKILARYASAGAVYRELLQNSNDAEATNAEVHFTVDDGNIVQQVMYRNNGKVFRDQDWARLKKIAEGNPDPSKIGAFGVGAYTMFSICEEPLVISGDQALAFVWRGDALWTKTALNIQKKQEMAPGGVPWTSFVLPSRDPYPLPSMEEFGSFLCSSLTFTRSLRNIRVFVNDKERVFIQKTQVKEPTTITPPQSSSWFSNDGAVTSSEKGTFYLPNNDKSIKESIYQIDVLIDDSASSIQARYVSAVAKTNISSQMAKRMERVTKKQPPKTVNVEIFLNAGQDESDTKKTKNPADRVTEGFLPQMGKGRIFIGFKTSQSTGLAAHLASSFIPTVEREAIDLQDPTLRVFNSELLQFSGILMRLSLEHAMSTLEQDWKQNAPAREKLEKEMLKDNMKAAAAKSNEAGVSSEESGVEEIAPNNSEDTSGGLFGFARFMAKGLKKQIVSVVNTVDKMLDDGSEYLNPNDPRPLCNEERRAILLMQSFCPQQSTPDPLVGMVLAQGFSRCMPNAAPPVLTRSGVIRGDQARLPNHGMESFVQDNVIRRVVYMNCEEYHDVIASCRKLKLEDVAHAISSDVLDQSKLVFFLNWWTRYSQIDQYYTRKMGEGMKEMINYYADPQGDATMSREIKYLKEILFYVEKDGVLSDPDLPMPTSVMPNQLQNQIGLRTLSDESLRYWFTPIPLEIWLEFISHHDCMTRAQPEDEKLRLKVLMIFSKEYDRRNARDRANYAAFVRTLLSDKRCIPFDSDHPTKFAADIPSNLYVPSAELKAFDGVGSFHKARKGAGISEEFLVELGVRKSIAVDFLFENLDTLAWNSDPKPLVEYLTKASLTSTDIMKLRQTRYLPAENDQSRTFAPSELFLPDPELRIFPFIRLLSWPSEDGLSAQSPDGKFLVSLGCHIGPSLETVLKFTSEQVKDEATRLKCLDFMSKRLGPRGVYRADYGRMSGTVRSKYKIIPSIRLAFLQPDSDGKPEICAPTGCYTDIACGIMCYPVIDPKLESRELYGTIFQCQRSPPADALLETLLVLVQHSQKQQSAVEGKTKKALSARILKTFGLIFQYLSKQTSDFDKANLATLKKFSFIPLANEEGIVEWYTPDQLFFKTGDGDGDSLTELLFKAVEFSSFLSAVGVKEQASAKDLFELLLQNPERILERLGEKKYRFLLRRLAANPPFSRVPKGIESVPFLLAYTSAGDDGSDNFKLAKPQDIYVIDNSFFGRMFNVLKAPHESDLEEFYCMLGSRWISKEVDKRYEIVGRAIRSADIVQALRDRIDERTPLLCHPHVTSRPLVPNAASLLTDEKLSLFKADGLLAVYTLAGSERRQRTTCCARSLDKKRNALYVTQDLDFFDVGQSIGDLILQRCQLEDAFFIASLLETSIDSLKSRGFPVDRILKPTRPPEEPKAPPAVQQSTSTSASQNTFEALETSSENRVDPKSRENSTSDVPGHSAAGDEAGDADVFTSKEILKMATEMFPQIDEKFLRDRLGASPDLDSIRQLTDEVQNGNYKPKSENRSSKTEDEMTNETTSVASVVASGTDEKTEKKSKGFKKSLGRAFGKVRSGHHGNSTTAAGGGSGGQHGPAISGGAGNHTGPVAPQHDAAAKASLEGMLKAKAKSSSPVNSKGIHSHDRLLTNVPKELDRGQTCEVVPGQSLKPFPGLRGDGRTHNGGIRVFSARNSPESEPFLQSHEDAIEKFALVLLRVASVYDISSDSIAIFYDSRGGTIAFNAGSSLHFNARFFYSLHYLQNQHESYECYSYWMVTFAHELAHNLVTAHNKEHGFYTESYLSCYLPKFVALLSSLPRNF